MKKGNTLGIILILIGVAWIIRQAGIVSINWVASIKILWPVFLVAAGATMMLGHRKKLITGIWVITFALLIGFGIYKRSEPHGIIQIQEKLEIDLRAVTHIPKIPAEKEILLEKGTEEGRLILQLGAVKVDLSKGNNDLLAQLDSNIPSLEQRLAQGRQAVLEYSHGNNKRKAIPHFNLKINPALLWNIDANMGVVDGKLDFSKISVKDVNLNLAAGALQLIFGEQQSDTKVTLRTGATDLDIYIPKDVGLKISSGNILSDLSFHNIALTKQEDVFVSENYDTAKQKIEIDIFSAMSAINIFAQ